MTKNQIKSLVEDYIAANPVPHITISVVDVTENAGIFNVVRSTTAKTLGDFDYNAYYKMLEDCVAKDTDITLILSGLQPEKQKSSFNRDPDKQP